MTWKLMAKELDRFCLMVVVGDSAKVDSTKAGSTGKLD